MTREDVLVTLRQSELVLREKGVRHAALFGSVARGDNRPDSDIDIMIAIDPTLPMTIYDYVDLKDFISSLFDGPVDVVDIDALKSHVRPSATANALYAF